MLRTRLRATPALIAGVVLSLAAATPAAATTFPVTNTNNSGPGSLRDAINLANASSDADTITVPAGHITIAGNGDDTNVTGDLDITQPVTINGAGAAQTTIDGGNNDRVFQMQTAADATLTGMTITGGNNTTGGAILGTAPNLTLISVDVKGNHAGGGGVSGIGGGIFVQTATPLNFFMSDSNVNDNHAGGGGGAGSGTGGGVVLAGTTKHTISIFDSSVSGNTAGGGGGGAAGTGGGLVESPAGGGCDITIKNSKFDGNTAGGGGTSGTAAGLLVSTSNPGPVAMTVDSTSASNNTAGGGGGSGTGGGLLVAAGSGGGTFNATGLTVDGNHAGGGGAGGSGTGPGLLLSSSTGPFTANIDRSSLSGNVAGGAGATGVGAGLYHDAGGAGGSSTITNTKVDGNSAGGGAASASGTATGLLISGPMPITIDRTTVSNNTAGGSGANSGVAAGIYTDPDPGFPVSIVNTTVSGNKALGATSSVGAGVLLSDGSPTLTNDTIDGNQTGGGAAVPIGGGIYNGSATAATVKNTIVSNNVATMGANCIGTINSAGHNLDGRDDCTFNAAGDLKNTNPQLGPLADNGGPTKTLNLPKGSPAVNAGDNNGCPATDQRGGARPQPPGGTCDIGAYEYGSLADLTLTSAPSPDPASAAKKLTYTMTATNTGPSPDDASGVKVTDTLPANAALVSAKSSQGSCSGKGPVTCTIGTLANGASAKLTIVAKPAHEGTAVNVPTVSGDPTDPDPANSTAQTSTKVLVGITSFGLHPRTFRAAGAGASIARSAGARVAYKLSDKATVTFRVQKPRQGRKSKSGKCGARSNKNKGGKRCTYYKSVKGSFKKKSKAGKNSFRFSGRLRRHKLPPGKYSLLATAKGKNGNSVGARASFKIKS